MKQRVCIAIAICLRPKVIIADEPTSALDVVVQRQVMETLGRVQQELGAAVILIGHDMGLMAQFVDRLGVMYAGRLVEVAPIRDIFTAAAASLYADADRQPAVAGAPGRPAAAFPVWRRCCATCRLAARSTRAARWPTDRCHTEKPMVRDMRTGRNSWHATSHDGAHRPARTSARPSPAARSRVEKFSLTIDAEQPRIIAVVGESGSGKTTLARLLLGLIRRHKVKSVYEGNDLSTPVGAAGAPFATTCRRSSRTRTRSIIRSTASTTC